MAQQTPQDSPPTALFGPAYTVLSWGSLVLLAVILAWLLGTLFINTRPGTAATEDLASAAPTLLAIAPVGGASGCPPLKIPAACAACHTVAGTSAAGTVGPELTYIRSVALERIASPRYTGSATTAEEYIRESINDPSAYVVPGENHVLASGASRMPATVGRDLDPADREALIKVLSCQPEEDSE